MIFIGGPWHARDEDVPDQPWKVQAYPGGMTVIYTPMTFGSPLFGAKRIMVAPEYQHVTGNTMDGLVKDVLMERWLRS